MYTNIIQRWPTYGTRAQSGTRDDFTWHATSWKFTKNNDSI